MGRSPCTAQFFFQVFFDHTMRVISPVKFSESSTLASCSVHNIGTSFTNQRRMEIRKHGRILENPKLSEGGPSINQSTDASQINLFFKDKGKKRASLCRYFVINMLYLIFILYTVQTERPCWTAPVVQVRKKVRVRMCCGTVDWLIEGPSLVSFVITGNYSVFAFPLFVFGEKVEDWSTE